VTSCGWVISWARTPSGFLMRAPAHADEGQCLRRCGVSDAGGGGSEPPGTRSALDLLRQTLETLSTVVRSETQACVSPARSLELG
jgi:hypothetical protein